VIKQSLKRIHFVGVGGAGVSALAHLMLQEGIAVTGSDCQHSAVVDDLRKANATIWVGHDERHVRSAGQLADMVVYSTAVPTDNPELVYARAHGVSVVTRQQFMTACALRKEAIVISGSHGKSTTTSMVATVFLVAQQDPTVVLGSLLLHDMGTSSGRTSNARLGHSKYFICEGDESNNSMLELQAKVAVVTNIDCDHMDFHGSLGNLKGSFIRFLNTPGKDGLSIVCTDDQNIRSILPEITSRVVSYGINSQADYSISGRHLNEHGGISFTVEHRQRGPLGIVNLRYPGDHNVLNSLATVAICVELGIKFDHVMYALENFPGVSRRYERLYHSDEYEVIDDYAHHPSEIYALLGAAREVFRGRRMRVIFEPHRYTRSKNLAEQFPDSFELADEIVLAPIYTAHEPVIAGIGKDYLNSFFERKFANDGRLKCLPDLEQIRQYILDTLQPGDVILTVGAGNVNLVAAQLAEALKQRNGVPSKRIAQDLLFPLPASTPSGR
jgi:UDP-N-acetylmuramate--alanine ligase